LENWKLYHEKWNEINSKRVFPKINKIQFMDIDEIYYKITFIDNIHRNYYESFIFDLDKDFLKLFKDINKDFKTKQQVRVGNYKIFLETFESMLLNGEII
jgi:hypothetical protein